MPGKLKVKIIAGRNLPVMDRSSDTTDAFVEIKLGTVTYKTDVCRKTLNPQWNSEWYKFEMEDAELQDEPLQIRLMDYDTYSANDAIGKVYLNLNPLLLPSSLAVSQDYSNLSSSQVKGLTISGWLPVYDTMHGIRGEVNIVVKLDLFEDFNRFRQSSCGIQFFSSSTIPEGYELKAIHGFVEELVLADDPEYQWIDKIRTPRSTNEARQTLFFKLNGQVKRKIGLKVLDIGANSVVGYKQCFDLEGECGVVVRGLGTAVTLDPITSLELQEAKREPSPLCRRSSDSDISVVPRDIFYSWRDFWSPGHSPSGNSLVITDKPNKPTPAVRPTEPLDMGEYPFLTLTKYPTGFVQHIGGVVSARAVKLLGVDEAETRDAWWTELRLEVRSHARALACNAVIAYCEQTTVWDDVCILCASGTAAVISQNPNIKQVNFNICILECMMVVPKVDDDDAGCSVYHIPYSEASHPFRMKLSKCLQCKKGKVGEILLSTADLMDGSNVEGKGSLIQASVTRVKRECKGEMNAKEVSDALPFIEYELHTQLMHRLSSSGCNGIIGLKVEICLGERILVGYATGTGIRLSALPPPLSPTENNDLVGSDEDDIEEELRELDLNSGNKETNIVEVGNDCGGGNVGVPPDGFLISTTQGIPGASAVGLVAVRNLQMFTQIWKAKMCPLPSSASISSQFHRLLQGVYFKLRGMTPCALANLRIKVDLPQPDDLQISVVGMAVGMAEIEKHLNNCNSNFDGIELKMSRVDEESARNTPTNRPSRKSIHTPPREQRYGVDVTPLCYVPGARISSYLGNLNFFFIRESSCIRESGGLSSFVHGFVAEVLAIVRAHVTAIGGNALISYTMSECYLMNNTHKNQAQCLINVGGDAVFVKYTECNV